LPSNSPHTTMTGKTHADTTTDGGKSKADNTQAET
jgi:hypothetical protein